MWQEKVVAEGCWSRYSQDRSCAAFRARVKAFRYCFNEQEATREDLSRGLTAGFVLGGKSVFMTSHNTQSSGER